MIERKPVYRNWLDREHDQPMVASLLVTLTKDLPCKFI
jgi:hypothetical protein